jgi:hypothetical protein
VSIEEMIIATIDDAMIGQDLHQGIVILVMVIDTKMVVIPVIMITDDMMMIDGVEMAIAVGTTEEKIEETSIAAETIVGMIDEIETTSAQGMTDIHDHRQTHHIDLIIIIMEKITIDGNINLTYIHNVYLKSACFSLAKCCDNSEDVFSMHSVRYEIIAH